MATQLAECLNGLGKLVGQVAEQAFRVGMVLDDPQGQHGVGVDAPQREVVWVDGRDAVGPQDVGREILQVAGHNPGGAGFDRGCHDVPVAGVGQVVEIVGPVLVARDEPVADHVGLCLHPAAQVLQRVAAELAGQGPGRFLQQVPAPRGRER